MYQPNKPRSECWLQTCHILGACWWAPAACAGFSLFLLLWWLMDVCNLQTKPQTAQISISKMLTLSVRLINPFKVCSVTYKCLHRQNTNLKMSARFLYLAHQDHPKKMGICPVVWSIAGFIWVYSHLHNKSRLAWEMNRGPNCAGVKTPLDLMCKSKPKCDANLSQWYSLSWSLYLWVGGPQVQSWSWHWSWGLQSDPSAYSAIPLGAWSPWTPLLDSEGDKKCIRCLMNLLTTCHKNAKRPSSVMKRFIGPSYQESPT